MLAEHGIGVADGGHDGDDHAWIIAYDERSRQVCGVDVPAGTYEVACALIIGQRKESTDRKTSLNRVLREFAIPV